MTAFPGTLLGETDEGAGQRPFIKGMTWGWTGRRGHYASQQAAESMSRLAETGTEWVCIAFAATMNTAHDPNIRWGDKSPSMVTDEEIRRAIDLARENGMRVILKPVVNCIDGTWRARIRFFRPVTDKERKAGITGHFDVWDEVPRELGGLVVDQKQWESWWSNYSKFILHYAKIAQEKKVPMLCVGCEMSSTEQFEKQWRQLISRVRHTYDGTLIYNANHGREKEIPWWDDLDVIGISAYYDIPIPDNTTEEKAVKTTTPQHEIENRLDSIKAELNEVAQRWNKPILFIETGVTNVRGCSRYPWEYSGERIMKPLDEQEQANYYRAMFHTFWDEPWFMGYAWWDWPAKLYTRESASKHRGFCCYGKQAEQVLREWYAKPK